MAHGGDTRLTPQESLNESYDWLLSLIGVSVWGYDSVNNGARRISVNSDGYQNIVNIEVPPTDPSQTNPSYKIYKNAGMLTVKIEMTIGSTTYTTNIIPIDNDTTIVYTEEVSSWT